MKDSRNISLAGELVFTC